MGPSLWGVSEPEGLQREGSVGMNCSYTSPHILSPKSLKSEAQTPQAKEEPEAVGAILYFFNPLFASINLKILFCREAILDS